MDRNFQNSSSLIPGIIAKVKALALIGCILLFSSVADLDAKEGLEVVNLKGVYAGEKLSEVEKTALTQLRSGIKKLYDIELPVLKAPVEIEPQSPMIILGGEAALTTGRISEEELNKVAEGGYIIISDENGVVIAGANSWNTQYGVYGFFEKLDVEFFLPRFTQALWPPTPPESIPWLSIIDTPDFVFRSGRSDVWRQMFNQLGDPRNGPDAELFDRKKTGSDLWIDHTAGYLAPKTLFGEDHPEFYALKKDGERIPADQFTDHRTPLCLSNDEMTNISADRALGWITQEPDKNYFFITYGDTGLWCSCNDCRRLDSRPRVFSDRLLHWVNPIAMRVKSSYPEKRLLTFAYGETDEPPLTHVPEHNVWIVGSTGLGNMPFWDHTFEAGKIPRKQFEKLKGWMKVVPSRYLVCEYQSNTYKPALIDSLAARLHYYKEAGVRGIVFTYGVPRNFKVLWQYLMSHLMWDMDQDPMKLAQNFVDYYFGPAADSIWKIFELSHHRYHETLDSSAKIENLYPKDFYSEEFTESILNGFKEAVIALQHRPKLLAEVQSEERFFIEDWMRHPSYTLVDEKATKVIIYQLGKLRELTGDSDKEKNDLIRDIHKIALSIDSTHRGTLQVVEKWIDRQDLFVTNFETLQDGVRLSPYSFMFSGFGPAKYGYNCPPKDASGVYVKGNSKHRSHRMVAEFTLDESFERKKTTLTLLGQAAPIFLFKPSISIRINGKEVYQGSADFVKNNWSRQSFTIPENYLLHGKNILEIVNTSLPASIVKWNQGWVLVAETVIKFN